MCHRMYLDVRNELQEPILSPCMGSGHLTQVIRHVDKDLTHGAVLTAPIVTKKHVPIPQRVTKGFSHSTEEVLFCSFKTGFYLGNLGWP